MLFKFDYYASRNILGVAKKFHLKGKSLPVVK